MTSIKYTIKKTTLMYNILVKIVMVSLVKKRKRR